MLNEPRRHHFVPQFYLRNFACDRAQQKVNALTKYGDRAVWRQRSIRYVGAEEDLYYHPLMTSPGELERVINRDIERPISESPTWNKITGRREDPLNEEDMPTLYVLIRHLEARTPHRFRTMQELVELCATKPEAFSQEEREMYRALRNNPDLQSAMFSISASALDWIWESYPFAHMTVCRTQVPLRTSSTPVHVLRAPDHPALYLPLPGQVPYTACLSLSRHLFVTLVLGDFDGPKFSNLDVSDDVARVHNRHRVAQFRHFQSNEHLITDASHLVEDMEWAGYEVEAKTKTKIVFRRDN